METVYIVLIETFNYIDRSPINTRVHNVVFDNAVSADLCAERLNEFYHDHESLRAAFVIERNFKE